MVAGFQRPGLNPRFWNHEPNTTGSCPPVAASAVPLVFRKQSRNGSATETAVPPSMPRNTFRRVNLLMATPDSQILDLNCFRHRPRRGNDLLIARPFPGGGDGI